MIGLALAVLACGAWIYLLTARGGFWRAAQRDDFDVPGSVQPNAQEHEWPSVVAIVPARDEAAVIGQTVRSLLRQDYRGHLEVLVVDDQSSDDTAAIALQAAESTGGSRQFTVVAAPRLRDGWTGKLSAVQCGLRYVQAISTLPEYLLLTDADIRHADGTLAKLVGKARRDGLVLTSLMAKLRCVSLAEHALVPAFVFFFQMLYPFAWVNRRDRTTAAAAGGCMLVETRALLDAGGIESIRGELIDDCALARLLKGSGGAIWLGLATQVASARASASVGDIRRMVARSAYAQLGYSPWWLFATTVAMIVIFIAPPLLAIFARGAAQLSGALAWALMAFAFQPMLRFYRVPAWWGVALPVIAGAYLVFTWDSAWQYIRGKGGAWKGRVYPGASRHEITKHGS